MGYPFSHVFHATCKISNPFILIIYLKKKYNPNMYKTFALPQESILFNKRAGRYFFAKKNLVITYIQNTQQVESTEMADNEEKSFSFFMSSKLKLYPEAVRPLVHQLKKMSACGSAIFSTVCKGIYIYTHVCTKENNGMAKNIMNLINRLESRPAWKLFQTYGRSN